MEPIPVQARAFPPKPVSRRLVFGTNIPDNVPESARVVHMPEMRDLVGDDIVEYAWWRQNQAPREHQIALRGARTPTGTRVLELQLPEFPADCTGMSPCCSGQPLTCKLLQKRHHCRSGRTWGGLNSAIRKPCGRLNPSHNLVRPAFDRNLGADINQHRARPSFNRTRNPIGLLLGKVLGGAQTHACRHRQCHPTIKIRYPQAQATGSRRPPNVDADVRRRIQPQVPHCPLPVCSVACNVAPRASRCQCRESL